MYSRLTIGRLTSALLALAFTVSPAVWGANVEKRVVFPKGKTSVSFKGKLPRHANDYDAYFFRAKAQQTLSIKLTSDDPEAYVAIFETRELGPVEDSMLANDEKSRQWSGKLPISSEYSVQVYGTSSDQASSGAAYTIEISLH
jgi:hypothetical protein